MQKPLLIPAVVAALALAACSKQESSTASPSTTAKLERAQVEAIFAHENVADLPTPDPGLVALGKDLYQETRLSVKDNLACASCHDLAHYGQDNQPTSPGSTGELGERNSPSSINAYRQFTQFWDGRAKTVEEQAMGPMMNPIEHGFTDEADIVAKLESIDGMAERFKQAFPGEAQPVSLVNFGKAVGAFERTLKTHSRFDDYLDGDDSALTAKEQEGLATFVSVGCITCHMGRTIGGGMFQKLGLVVPYETGDVGRAKVTGNDADKYFFKVPMLLNVAETAPYFHDGSVKTLPEAVRLMGEHQLGRDLTGAQIDAIVAFLKSLTGELAE